MKARRQAKLLSFINDGLVASQGDAVSLLEKAGMKATQATVSRDLEELGAIRVRHLDGIRYSIAEDSSQTFGAPLKQVIREYVISNACSGNIIVLKTPPGHASVVAAAFDRAPTKSVIGTIAGDDTIFLCVAEGKKIGQVKKELGL